jgi:hypothetical protein
MIQGALEIVAPFPTNQYAQSQPLPSPGSNTTSNNSNNGSPGSNRSSDSSGTQSQQESHHSHESDSNPDSRSGSMDRNQNGAPNETNQDFGEAGQN